MEPEVLVKQIWYELEKKDHDIKNGETIDLSGIENQVRVFCEVLGTLPSQDALKFEEDLKRIMDRLITWSSLLEERKRQIFKKVKNLNAQSEAQVAYMTTASMTAATDKPSNDE